MNRKEVFNECIKEAKEILLPNIKYTREDDDLIIQLAFILFEHELK